MQEALISLMQMAKTSAVIERLKAAGVPYVSVMTDPIYGGVSASLALLGDINVAEPDARAGLLGPTLLSKPLGRSCLVDSNGVSSYSSTVLSI